MKALIRDQLRNDITEGNFDIGYLQSNTRSKEDLAKIWATIKRGANVTMWCDGLKATAGAATSKQKRQ